jgi:hypothetical protein
MDSGIGGDDLFGMGRMVFLAILEAIVSSEHIRRTSRRHSRPAVVIRFGQAQQAD